MPKWVMVLNDGTTYTDLDGCSIVAVPDNLPDDVVDDFVSHADGWYCFDSQPPMDSNNGFTQKDIDNLNETHEYTRVYEDDLYRRDDY